jgi:ankyrin repeat protein
MVRLLLQHGANPNRRNGTLPTLILAVGVGDRPIVQQLLEAGASPNAVTCFQVTALGSAEAEKDWQMVRLLHSASARR